MELTEFVMRRYDGVYRYVAYRMHGSDAAADVTQEVFLKFCARFRDGLPKAPQAYLYAMARNETADFFRHAKAENVLDESISNAENIVEDICERDAVRYALSLLPREMREALVLRYLCDLSVGEIAKTLNLPLPTVKTRLRRGKAKMKEILEGRTPK